MSGWGRVIQGGEIGMGDGGSCSRNLHQYPNNILFPLLSLVLKHGWHRSKLPIGAAEAYPKIREENSKG